MDNCRFMPSRLIQDAAIVSSAQSPQGELRRRKVVHARIQIGKVSANNVQLDFVERSGAGCGAKINFTARMLPMPSDPGGEIQQLGQRRQLWTNADCLTLRPDALGNCIK